MAQRILPAEELREGVRFEEERDDRSRGGAATAAGPSELGRRNAGARWADSQEERWTSATFDKLRNHNQTAVQKEENLYSFMLPWVLH